MTLQAYIKKHGVAECAQRFKVDKRSVRNWLNRRTLPQRGKLPLLRKVTGLSMAEIYG